MVGLRGRHERRAGRALAGLYEEHGAAVFAFALHLCGSREDAEDVVQTAYLQAFRALADGEQLVNPRAWLMVVARRQVYNLWRGRRETAAAEPVDVPAVAPDAEAAAELGRVRMVLFSLPEAQHQAFVLRHWSGLSNREIGEVLGTSESAVETLLVRARSAILASGDEAGDTCSSVRERLAAARVTAHVDVEHVRTCRGCRRAQERLARVSAAAAVLALVPRAHVAQALAASVPGFGASGGVAAGLAAGKATAAKLAMAGAVSAGTIAITAPTAMQAIHQHLRHPWRGHTAHPVAVQAHVVAVSPALAGVALHHPSVAPVTTASTPRRRHDPSDDGGEVRVAEPSGDLATAHERSGDGHDGGGREASSSSSGQDGGSGGEAPSSDPQTSGGQDGGQDPAASQPSGGDDSTDP
ncbi:MAG TPA: RNA polymerase sigma factor [Gaiellales bacterium]|jgi:RNA polymerase sigma-70 factor (ECF subfamily)